MANAGLDQRVQEQVQVNLPGSATDADGSITSYVWTQTGGPAVTLGTPASSTASFTAPAVTETTTLTFDLKVTDDRGATASDTVTVTVVKSGIVSGRVTYDRVPFKAPPLEGLDYAATTQAPVRGAVIEAISSTDDTTILASGTMDEDGNYSLTFPAGAGFFLRVKAQLAKSGSPSWNFRVVNNRKGDALYVLDSADFTNDGAVHDLRAVSGWGGSSYTGTRAAAPFAILDSVYDAMNLVLSVAPGAGFPALDIHWSTENRQSDTFDPDAGDVGTFFRSGGTRPGIYLLGTENVDTDEYDSHVIIHEWGHYFQSSFSRDDSVGGDHSLSNRLDFRVAFSEGWGNAFSGMVTGNPRYQDSSGAQQGGGFTVNVEQNPSSSSTTQNGWYSEAAVQTIFYDVFDSAGDGETISLGFGPIFQSMAGHVRNSEALTTLYPFLVGLREQSPESAAAIDSLAAARGVTAADDHGSTESNNGGSTENLPLYRSLSIGAPAIQVCSRTNFGEVNRLGNRRFVRFSVPGTQQVTFKAVGPVGSDPDLELFHGGTIATSVADSTSNGTEQFTRQLSEGNYVLEVYDFKAVDDDTSTAGSCMNVSIG